MNFVKYLAILLFALPVIGQIWTPPNPPSINMTNQIWRGYSINKIGINAIGAAAINGARVKKASKAKNIAKPLYPKEFAFTPSGFSLLAEAIANADATQDRQKLDKFFTKLWTDYQSSLAAETSEYGMPTADVCTAFTYFIVINYMSANGLNSLETKFSVSVYEQLKDVLSANSDLAKLTAKDRELLAEILVSVGGMPSLAYGYSKDSTALRRDSLENLKGIFGDNAAILVIDANGISIKKRVQASPNPKK